MAKLPRPPGVDALQTISPQLTCVTAGRRVFRIFRASGRYPGAWDQFRYFGPTSARFDHHRSDSKGQPCTSDRGVLYGALNDQQSAVTTCIAEFFQINRTIDRNAGDPVLAAFAIKQDLTLLDMTATFPTQIGASMAINTGPKPRAQLWAQQLYEAYPSAQGILYPSSMNANQPAVALWERGLEAIPATCDFHRYLSDSALDNVLNATASTIGYMLLR